MESKHSSFSACIILLNVFFERLSMCIRTSPAHMHEKLLLAKETDVTVYGRWHMTSPDYWEIMKCIFVSIQEGIYNVGTSFLIDHFAGVVRFLFLVRNGFDVHQQDKGQTPC